VYLEKCNDVLSIWATAGSTLPVPTISATAAAVSPQIKWCVINRGFPLNKINQNGPVQFFLYAVSEYSPLAYYDNTPPITWHRSLSLTLHLLTVVAV
jgi:hypothetical protein